MVYKHAVQLSFLWILFVCIGRGNSASSGVKLESSNAFEGLQSDMFPASTASTLQWLEPTVQSETLGVSPPASVAVTSVVDSDFYHTSSQPVADSLSQTLSVSSHNASSVPDPFSTRTLSTLSIRSDTSAVSSNSQLYVASSTVEYNALSSDHRSSSSATVELVIAPSFIESLQARSTGTTPLHSTNQLPFTSSESVSNFTSSVPVDMASRPITLTTDPVNATSGMISTSVLLDIQTTTSSMIDIVRNSNSSLVAKTSPLPSASTPLNITTAFNLPALSQLMMTSPSQPFNASLTTHPSVRSSASRALSITENLSTTVPELIPNSQSDSTSLDTFSASPPTRSTADINTANGTRSSLISSVSSSTSTLSQPLTSVHVQSVSSRIATTSLPTYEIAPTSSHDPSSSFALDFILMSSYQPCLITYYASAASGVQIESAVTPSSTVDPTILSFQSVETSYRVNTPLLPTTNSGATSSTSEQGLVSSSIYSFAKDVSSSFQSFDTPFTTIAASSTVVVDGTVLSSLQGLDPSSRNTVPTPVSTTEAISSSFQDFDSKSSTEGTASSSPDVVMSSFQDVSPSSDGSFVTTITTVHTVLDLSSSFQDLVQPSMTSSDVSVAVVTSVSASFQEVDATYSSDVFSTSVNAVDSLSSSFQAVEISSPMETLVDVQSSMSAFSSEESLSANASSTSVAAVVGISSSFAIADALSSSKASDVSVSAAQFSDVTSPSSTTTGLISRSQSIVIKSQLDEKATATIAPSVLISNLLSLADQSSMSIVLPTPPLSTPHSAQTDAFSTSLNNDSSTPMTAAQITPTLSVRDPSSVHSIVEVTLNGESYSTFAQGNNNTTSRHLEPSTPASDLFLQGSSDLTASAMSFTSSDHAQVSSLSGNILPSSSSYLLDVTSTDSIPSVSLDQSQLVSSVSSLSLKKRKRRDVAAGINSTAVSLHDVSDISPALFTATSASADVSTSLIMSLDQVQSDSLILTGATPSLGSEHVSTVEQTSAPLFGSTSITTEDLTSSSGDTVSSTSVPAESPIIIPTPSVINSADITTVATGVNLGISLAFHQTLTTSVVDFTSPTYRISTRVHTSSLWAGMNTPMPTVSPMQLWSSSSLDFKSSSSLLTSNSPTETIYVFKSSSSIAQESVPIATQVEMSNGVVSSSFTAARSSETSAAMVASESKAMSESSSAVSYSMGVSSSIPSVSNKSNSAVPNSSAGNIVLGNTSSSYSNVAVDIMTSFLRSDSMHSTTSDLIGGPSQHTYQSTVLQASTGEASTSYFHLNSLSDFGSVSNDQIGQSTIDILSTSPESIAVTATYSSTVSVSSSIDRTSQLEIIPSSSKPQLTSSSLFAHNISQSSTYQMVFASPSVSQNGALLSSISDVSTFYGMASPAAVSSVMSSQDLPSISASVPGHSETPRLTSSIGMCFVLHTVWLNTSRSSSIQFSVGVNITTTPLNTTQLSLSESSEITSSQAFVIPVTHSPSNTFAVLQNTSTTEDASFPSTAVASDVTLLTTNMQSQAILASISASFDATTAVYASDVQLSTTPLFVENITTSTPPLPSSSNAVSSVQRNDSLVVQVTPSFLLSTSMSLQLSVDELLSSTILTIPSRTGMLTNVSHAPETVTYSTTVPLSSDIGVSSVSIDILQSMASSKALQASASTLLSQSVISSTLLSQPLATTMLSQSLATSTLLSQPLATSTLLPHSFATSTLLSQPLATSTLLSQSFGASTPVAMTPSLQQSISSDVTTSPSVAVSTAITRQPTTATAITPVPSPSSSVLASSSIAVIPPSPDLLDVVLKVNDLAVDVSASPFKTNLEAKLAETYNSVISIRKRRAVTVSNTTATITTSRRLIPSDNVVVEFFILDNGQAVPGTSAESNFNRLSLSGLEVKLGYPVVREVQVVAPPTSQPPQTTSEILGMVVKDSSQTNLSLIDNQLLLAEKLAAYYKTENSLSGNVTIQIVFTKREATFIMYVEFEQSLDNLVQNSSTVAAFYRTKSLVAVSAAVNWEVVASPYALNDIVANTLDYVILMLQSSANVLDVSYHGNLTLQLETLYRTAKAVPSQRRRRAIGSVIPTIVNVTQSAPNIAVNFYLADSGIVLRATALVAILNRLTSAEMGAIMNASQVVSLSSAFVLPPGAVVSTKEPELWIIAAVLAPIALALTIIGMIYWRWSSGGPQRKIMPEEVKMMEQRQIGKRQPPSDGTKETSFTVQDSHREAIPAKRTTLAGQPERSIFERTGDDLRLSMRKKVKTSTPLSAQQMRHPPTRQHVAKQLDFSESEESQRDTEVIAKRTTNRLPKPLPRDYQPHSQLDSSYSSSARPAKVDVNALPASRQSAGGEHRVNILEDDSDDAGSRKPIIKPRSTTFAGIPAISQVSEIKSVQTNPPVRFRTKVKPASILDQALPPLGPQPSSLVLSTGSPTALFTNPLLHQDVDPDLKQKAEIERQRNKDRLRSQVVGSQHTPHYPQTNDKEWLKSQQQINAALDPLGAPLNPYITSSKTRKRRRMRRKNKVDISSSHGVNTGKLVAPSVKLNSYSKFESPRMPSAFDNSREDEAASDDSEISMKEARNRMHALLDDAFTLLQPMSKKSPGSHGGNDSSRSPDDRPHPFSSRGHPSLPAPPPRELYNNARVKQPIGGYHGTPYGFPMANGMPQMTPIVGKDPVAAWDPMERQRYMNSLHPRPMYGPLSASFGYPYDPVAGQNVFVTPVQQKPDGMGGLVWSPYSSETPVAGNRANNTTDGNSFTPFGSSLPNSRLSDPAAATSGSMPLSEPRYTTIDAVNTRLGGKSSQPLIHAIKDELMRLSHTAEQRNKIEELKPT